MILLIVLLIWATCGVLAYGLTFGYFIGRYPMLSAKKETGLALHTAVLGPIGLVIALSFGAYKYPLRFRPQTEEELNADFNKWVDGGYK